MPAVIAPGLLPLHALPMPLHEAALALLRSVAAWARRLAASFDGVDHRWVGRLRARPMALVGRGTSERGRLVEKAAAGARHRGRGAPGREGPRRRGHRRS